MSDVDVAAGAAETPAAVIEAPDALDGKALIDSVASEMGWSPKDKWKGDPEKWRDSDAFLKATPAVLKSTRDQVERSNRVAQQAIEKAQREAIAAAEKKIADAAEVGDKEAAAEATRELREASRAPDPAVTDFATRNAWYMTNRAATNLAVAIAEEVMQSGGTVADQLAAAEKEVRKRFPELFGEAPEEAPASRAAPAVHGGQRAASPAPRKRGWSDLPAGIRQQVTPKTLKGFSMTEAEYAEFYFAENG